MLVDNFLIEFFGHDNALKWDKFAPGLNTLESETYEELIERLYRTSRSILPRLHQDGSVTWYAIAPNPTEASLLRNEVKAWIGPTYSNFDGMPGRPSKDDPIEDALEKYVGTGTWYPLRELDPKFRPILKEKIELLKQSWAKRPLRRSTSLDPVGRIISNFKLALMDGNDQEAAQCIEELRQRGLLDHENLAFLDIQRLGAGKRWDEIRNHDSFRDHLQNDRNSSRPARVTELLIETLYRTHADDQGKTLFEYQGEGDAENALIAFGAIRTNFSSLLKSRQGLKSEVVLNTFMLDAVTAKNADKRNTLLDLADSTTPSFSYLQSLASLLTEVAVSEVGSSRSARDAFAEGDVDLALQLAVQESDFRILVRCAAEIRTYEAATVAREAFKDASEEEKKALAEHPSFARAWAQLEPLFSSEPDLPATWVEWLERLQGTDWPEAREIANRCKDAWSDPSVAQNPGHLRRLAETLEFNFGGHAADVVSQFLPDIAVLALTIEETPGLSALCEALIPQLCVRDRMSANSIFTIGRLIAQVARGGCGPAEYREMVEWLIDAWKKPSMQSTYGYPRLISALDQLIDVPASDPQARIELLELAINEARKSKNSADFANLSVLKNCCDELEYEIDGQFAQTIENQAEVQAHDPIAEFLSNKVVGIYSLDASIRRRMSELLTVLAPGVKRVDVYEDKVASNRLRNAARTCDFFIVDTAHAKHEASNCIVDNRPQELETCQTHERGVPSMLNAIRERILRIIELRVAA